MNIEPILIINKSDIADENFVENIKLQYYFLKIFLVSAKTKYNLDIFVDYISGKFCALSGQSAVGKSSLINAIIPDIDLKTQELSRKIDRGKHTTRTNQLYIYDDLLIVDTPGFNSLDLNIDYRQLASYYPEFESYASDCKYLDCSHIKEGKDCGIYHAVRNNEVNQQRYERYIQLYTKLKKEWDSKYD